MDTLYLQLIGGYYAIKSPCSGSSNELSKQKSQYKMCFREYTQHLTGLGMSQSKPHCLPVRRIKLMINTISFIAIALQN